MADHTQKPIFETAVNVAAIALTAWGSTEIQNGRVMNGVVGISVGFVLEFLKYTLRSYKHKLGRHG